MKRCPLVALVLMAGLLARGPVAAQAPAPAQPASAPQRQATAPAGNAQEGKKLFVTDGCYQCHGYEGQGSSATGPRLGPRPIAYAAFSRYVRQPTGQMPLYTTKVLSDTELANIYAFLQALPPPPPVQGIPLLR
jgi:ubiquinol-cytochrome c reductase cytochrome c subunit